MNGLRFIWFLSAISTAPEPVHAVDVVQMQTPSGIRNVIIEDRRWINKNGRDESSCNLCSLQGTLDGLIEIIDADTGQAVMTFDPSLPMNREFLEQFPRDE